MRHAASLFLTAVVLLGLGGCGRVEERVDADWQSFLSEHQTCSVDADCAVVYPGCPLGCANPVQSAALEEANTLASELVDRYERGGRSCIYDCAQAGEPICGTNGECALDVADTGL